MALQKEKEIIRKVKEGALYLETSLSNYKQVKEVTWYADGRILLATRKRKGENKKIGNMINNKL